MTANPVSYPVDVDGLLNAKTWTQILARELGLTLHQAIALPPIQELLKDQNLEPIGDLIRPCQLEVGDWRAVYKVLKTWKQVAQQEEVA